MGVAEGMNELSGLQLTYLSHHHSQKSVRSDVEGNSEKDICASLVELARESSAGNIELEQCVAGRQSHALQFAHVPGAHDVASRFGMSADLLDDMTDLIDGISAGGWP